MVFEGVGVGDTLFVGVAIVVSAFGVTAGGAAGVVGCGAGVTAGVTAGCAAGARPGAPSFVLTNVTRTSPSAWLLFSLRNIFILSARRMLSFCCSSGFSVNVTIDATASYEAIWPVA